MKRSSFVTSAILIFLLCAYAFPSVAPKETVTFKELRMSEVIQAEALINLLDRKGILSKQELLEEIKAVRASMLR